MSTQLLQERFVREFNATEKDFEYFEWKNVENARTDLPDDLKYFIEKYNVDHLDTESPMRFLRYPIKVYPSNNEENEECTLVVNYSKHRRNYSLLEKAGDIITSKIFSQTITDAIGEDGQTIVSRMQIKDLYIDSEHTNPDDKVIFDDMEFNQGDLFIIFTSESAFQPYCDWQSMVVINLNRNSKYYGHIFCIGEVNGPQNFKHIAGSFSELIEKMINVEKEKLFGIGYISASL